MSVHLPFNYRATSYEEFEVLMSRAAKQTEMY